MSEKITYHKSGGTETRTRTRGDGHGGTISTTSRVTRDPVFGHVSGGRIVSETHTDKNGNSTTKKR